MDIFSSMSHTEAFALTGSLPPSRIEDLLDTEYQFEVALEAFGSLNQVIRSLKDISKGLTDKELLTEDIEVLEQILKGVA